jgi:hypothetical protein
LKIRLGFLPLIAYLMVVLYLVADLALTIGHGYGRKAWCNISLPASVLVPADSNFLWCFLAGLAQYILITFALNKLIRPATDRVKR